MVFSRLKCSNFAVDNLDEENDLFVPIIPFLFGLLCGKAQRKIKIGPTETMFQGLSKEHIENLFQILAEVVKICKKKL